MKIDSQTKAVADHLGKYESITSWEAIERYHITRLSSIIYRLKRLGYRIEDEWCTNLLDGCRYKRYYLVTEGE